MSIFFWPPADAVASWIAEGLYAGNPDARLTLHGLYWQSDSDRSYYLLRQVGLDMAKPQAYEAIIHRINRQIDELEKLLPPQS